MFVYAEPKKTSQCSTHQLFFVTPSKKNDGLAVLYNLPQIYHVYRVKTVQGVSSTSILLRMVSYGLIMFHSYKLADPAILYTTSAGLAQLCIMYAQTCLYRKKEDVVILE